MECQRAVVMGHPGGELRHLPQPHHGPLHRVPGKSGEHAAKNGQNNCILYPLTFVKIGFTSHPPHMLTTNHYKFKKKKPLYEKCL